MARWRNLPVVLLFQLSMAAASDFAPDPTFGTDGRTTIGALGPVHDHATSIVVASGEHRLFGVTQSGAQTVSSARLDASGDPVPTYGTQGFLITAASGVPLIGASLVDSQGRTVVATFNPVSVARFLTSGALDLSFAGDGTWNPSDESAVFDVALGPGDSIWVSKSVAQFANSEILQLSAAGVPTAYESPDNSSLGFIPFGYARFHREADGSFWWATRSATEPFEQVVARFTAAGALDPGFSADGIARATVDCIQGDVGRRYQAFTVLPGGIAVVRGDHAGGSYMVAVYPDGTAGPARCETTAGTIATTQEIAPRDSTRFVAASFHCRGDGHCGALLRQFAVQPNGTIADEPPPDLDAATQFFPTSDGSMPSATGNDVVVDQGRPVLIGSANKTATDADFFAIRYFATSIFANGFE